MKMIAFARRNTKEILRDPITLFFGIGFASCNYACPDSSFSKESSSSLVPSAHRRSS